MSNRDKIRQFKQEQRGRRVDGIGGQLKHLLNKCANQRGNKSEDYVKEALESLKNEGLIVSFYMTKKWSRQDKQGIDAVIFLNDGTEVKKQIKSSVSGVEKHLRQQEQHGGEEIGVIYGSYLPGEDFEAYEERIYKTIIEGAI